MKSLKSCCVAEALGTFVLIFFGCGSVHCAVLTGALAGLWQVAIVWGIAVMLGVYLTAPVSGGHLNPAITVAFAFWRSFDRGRVGPYIASQIAGAFVAAAALYVIFGPLLALKEQEKSVVRGQAGSEITAMCYGEFFPSPGPLASGTEPYSTQKHDELNRIISEPIACFGEIIGTMILGLVVCALTEPRNDAGPQRLAPLFIGLAVAALICVFGPLTQACFNPARDFGPRLFSCLAGWGTVALPGLRSPIGFATVYLISPTVGATLGVGLYRKLIQPALMETVAQS